MKMFFLLIIVVILPRVLGVMVLTDFIIFPILMIVMNVMKKRLIVKIGQ
tara:strand:+ start:1370 stop:1516 length:147 start_codon:yes stop_codon:yes gene_type:complete